MGIFPHGLIPQVTELEAEIRSKYGWQYEGYVKGIGPYSYNRGYAEGNNKLPVSSHNANYTHGHNDATGDLDNADSFGSLPAQTRRPHGSIR